jgi:catechol 2,3-dioxygenase-like lactoylglutathione lyase family enzyme
MLHKIDHVNLVVRDLEDARDFFCRLGFAVTHAGELEGGWISAVVGLADVRAAYVQLSLSDEGCNLELIAFDNPPSPPAPPERRPNQLGIRHIAFAVNDIDTLVTRLQADGISFFSDVQTYPATGKKLVYCHGPEGIILEFAQYP